MTHSSNDPRNTPDITTAELWRVLNRIEKSIEDLRAERKEEEVRIRTRLHTIEGTQAIHSTLIGELSKDTDRYGAEIDRLKARYYAVLAGFALALAGVVKAAGLV